MLVAKPLQAFIIGKKCILSCEVAQENPYDFLNKEMWFYSSESRRKRIRVEGISTASDMEHSVYDFHYSGMVIVPEEITGRSIITDAEYQEAFEQILSMQG